MIIVSHTSPLMRANGFWIHDHLYTETLRLAGE